MPKLNTLLPIYKETPQFPGRWLSAVSLILGPLLILTGILLRYQFDFFFPAQLAAVGSSEPMMFAAYSSFLLGNVILWPGIFTLAQRISIQKPGLAIWGGALVIFGLFARTFHAGIDHLAFQLVEAQGVEAATEFIKATYGSYHVMSFFNAAILAGWLVLAMGAFRAKVLPIWGAIALALMSVLPLGVLKGATTASIVAGLGLCVALVPFGIRLISDGPKPALGVVVRWILAIAVLGFLFYFLGIAG